MKKSIKIVSILMIALMLIMTTTSVFATNTTTTPKNVKITENNVTGITNMGGRILGIIRVIGTIVAVGALLVLGIKYMMGSVEEKAEYKKAFIPYFIGAILLFAAVNLADMIYQWANSI